MSSLWVCVLVLARLCVQVLIGALVRVFVFVVDVCMSVVRIE